MAPAHRRRPIVPGHPLGRPLGAALALSLAAGPLLLSAQGWAGESAAPPSNPTVSASPGGATDQPRDRTDRPGPSTPRLVRPLQRVPGLFIIDATVHGTVRGAAGGALFIGNSTLHGGVHSSGGTLFGMCGSTATGMVAVDGASGFVVIGDPGDDGCAGNRVSGSVHLGDNHSGAELIANRIGGSVEVNGTTGTGPFPEDTQAEIEGNTIGGSLHCMGNTPPPTNGGNANTVHGSRHDQCANL
ncbi:hypothetical protein [Kitasatospora aureofaciens]|uniref:hypothetical protein n=1 Tax=Kitasatospora aureofaciens TaxID=1894 RepID=UPI001C48D91E|nr:hypothetical protein [Kitasatospora aureofaciens]MBV6699833.1 hypothetical protein [Kitasatospora aureofaciens]